MSGAIALTPALAVGVAVLGASGVARANGRYPSATLIAFDPGDPSHFVLSATFGLVESRDGGKTFRWACESALGAMGAQDLVVAITASGATVTAKFDGIVTSPDGCSFHGAPELDQKSIGDLSLRRAAPHGLLAFYSQPRDGGGFESRIVESADDGQTWTEVGPLLPSDLYPLTIDVAPSDASRVYLSARLGAADDYASALFRSNDGGATFDRIVLPDTAQHRLAYIAAVHPADRNRIYLRIYDPTGTRVLLSDDAGTTVRTIFTGTDQLYGFALSPDGTEVALGGPGDGIWIGASDGTGFARRSDVLPNCLGWTDAGLFVCADQRVAPFSLGRSLDRAATFETMLRFDALCGYTGCGADTESGRKCPADWELVAPQLQTTCGTGAGSSDAGGNVSSDAAMEASPPRDASSADAASADSQPGNEDAPSIPEAIADPSGGGGCAFSPHRPPSRGRRGGGGAGRSLLIFLAGGMLAVRRRRHDQVVTIA